MPPGRGALHYQPDARARAAECPRLRVGLVEFGQQKTGAEAPVTVAQGSWDYTVASVALRRRMRRRPSTGIALRARIKPAGAGTGAALVSTVEPTVPPTVEPVAIAPPGFGVA